MTAVRRADRTRTCNLRFWRPLRYQLRHYPMEETTLPVMPLVSEPATGTDQCQDFNTEGLVYSKFAVPSNRAVPGAWQRDFERCFPQRRSDSVHARGAAAAVRNGAHGDLHLNWG
jgi:hypothetical protein